MGLSDEQTAFDDDLEKLRAYAKGQGFRSVISEVARTEAQQAIYVKTGRSQTMKSNHLRKLAADLEFFRDGVWINGLAVKDCLAALAPLGKFWESLHPLNRWGGNFDKNWDKIDSFVDAPHFERNV